MTVGPSDGSGSEDRVGGLVAVHAHPDDETLATGALLATFARAGAPVTVVTATRGERGEVIGDALAHLEGDGPALAAHRETELAAALGALGVHDHTFLDRLPPADGRRYEDSGMVWAGAARAALGSDVPERAFVGVPLEEAAERLAGLLRRRRPAVVATYDPEGGYGHPDHVRTHEVTMRAVALAAGAGWSPVVLWRRAGRHAQAAAAAALATHGPWPEGLTVTGPGDEPAALVVVDAAVTVRVDARAVAEPLLEALRAHRTQVQAVTPLSDARALGAFALSNRRVQPVLPDEGYEVAAGDVSAVRWPDGVRSDGAQDPQSAPVA